MARLLAWLYLHVYINPVIYFSGPHKRAYCPNWIMKIWLEELKKMEGAPLDRNLDLSSDQQANTRSVDASENTLRELGRPPKRL